MNTLKYRNELKYICSTGQMEVIKARLSSLIPLDENTGECGFYNIRSLYFDDMYDSSFYDNEFGVDHREKFRIRMYNGEKSLTKLEIKRKDMGKISKASAPISEENCRKLMAGIPIHMSSDFPPQLKRLLAASSYRMLKPKVIVEFTRVPYIYHLGNVRITIDMDIVSSGRVGKFIDGGFPRRPILPLGQHLLEVKFDEFLPDFIKESLELNSLEQTAFSKYYLCRKYNV